MMVAGSSQQQRIPAGNSGAGGNGLADISYHRSCIS
jgi:hypothetical protein